MKLGAVIVLFNPDLDACKRLISVVSQQADLLCVIDNSASPTEFGLANDSLIYHHFPDNIGIAAAQNVGLQELMTAHCNYALLLDQDSLISHSFVSSLSQALIRSQQEGNNIVAIGPRIICSFSDKAIKPLVEKETLINDDLLAVNQIISSGMLIDIQKVSQVGLKDESLFIDGVDHEWCWRAKQKRFVVGIARNIEMVHSVGDSRSKFAGITYKVGSPIRLYYQFRNILILTRRGYVPMYWKARNIVLLPLRFFANATLQPNRKLRLLFMLKGLWDGLRHKEGAFHENWKSNR